MATIEYIGNVDTLYILTKLKAVLDGGYVAQEAGKGLSTEDFTTALLTKLNGIQAGATATSFDRTVTSGTKIATITINGTAIDIYTPTIPTLDTAMSSTSTKGVQNKVIKKYVDDAVGAVIQIKFDADTTGLGYTSLSDLQTKHPTGENGTIYLVQNSGSSPNAKDEYFWNSATTPGSYEKFGTTDVDLSGYVQTSDLVEISASDIDSMFASVFGS